MIQWYWHFEKKALETGFFLRDLNAVESILERMKVGIWSSKDKSGLQICITIPYIDHLERTVTINVHAQTPTFNFAKDVEI